MTDLPAEVVVDPFDPTRSMATGQWTGVQHRGERYATHIQVRKPLPNSGLTGEQWTVAIYYPDPDAVSPEPETVAPFEVDTPLLGKVVFSTPARLPSGIGPKQRVARGQSTISLASALGAAIEVLDADLPPMIGEGPVEGSSVEG